jgi:hypothetical protein
VSDPTLIPASPTRPRPQIVDHKRITCLACDAPSNITAYSAYHTDAGALGWPLDSSSIPPSEIPLPSPLLQFARHILSRLQ